MFRAALLWQACALTGSPLALGAVGAANAVPGIMFNLLGGVFADKLDKRVLIRTTQTTTGCIIFLLGILTVLGYIRIKYLMVLAFMAGSVEAFDTSARQAFYPNLIDRKAMTSAVAMNSSVWQGTSIIAPAIAGFIIDFVSIGASYFMGGWLHDHGVGDPPTQDTAHNPGSPGGPVT